MTSRIDPYDWNTLMCDVAEELQRQMPAFGTGDAAWTRDYDLSHLGYDERIVQELMKEGFLGSMDEFVGRQLLYTQSVARGRIEEARDLITLLGGERFGPPGVETRARLDAINDLRRLRIMARRVLDAAGWEDVLTTSD